MPRIFDNINQRLLPSLKETLRVSYRADFASWLMQWLPDVEILDPSELAAAIDQRLANYQAKGGGGEMIIFLLGAPRFYPVFLPFGVYILGRIGCPPYAGALLGDDISKNMGFLPIASGW